MKYRRYDVDALVSHRIIYNRCTAPPNASELYQKHSNRFIKIIITAHALFVYICGDESASSAYIMYVTRSVNTTPIRERLPSVSHESTKTCTTRIVRLPDLHAARSSHICAPVCVCTFSIFTEIFRKSRSRQLTLSTPRGQTDRDTERPTHCVSVNICTFIFQFSVK